MNRDLKGRRIIVTRPEQRAAAMARRLEELGGAALIAPVIVPVPPPDTGPLDLAISRLAQYQWVVFTSAQGVDSFVERLLNHRLDVGALADASLAAIGSRTAERLREVGLRADLVPEDYRAEALADALVEAGARGRTVLVPRSALARPVLVERLRQAGALVDEVSAYTVEPASELPGGVVEALHAGAVDMVSFTSSSTVDHFLALARAAGVARAVEGLDIACIGPITADSVRRHRLEPAVVADEYTVAGLVAAIAAFYAAA